MKTVANKPFSSLAPYYDAVYHRKNYTQEVLHIDSLVKKHLRTKEPSLLDIGVGTGEHLVEFIRRGYNATGIDLSQQMLDIATKKLSHENLSATLTCADARSFQLHKEFDVIVSLFHVLSYQISQLDVAQFFSRAAAHMNNNSVFVFDCWYGPGVQSLPPEDSVQKYSQGSTVITRHKHPILMPKTNTVTVTHDYTITKRGSLPQHFTEIHTVRYFFYPQIEQFLLDAGLKIIAWGSLGKKLSIPKGDAWEIHVIAQKI